MNIDQLIAEAAKIKGWHITESYTIRIRKKNGDHHCPISAVYSKKTRRPCCAREASIVIEQLGLRDTSGHAIINAADDNPGCDRRLRRKMLKAFKLSDMS